MENILNKKLHIKPGYVLSVINAPEDYLSTLSPLPEKAAVFTKIIRNCDFIQYFVSSKKELEKALPLCIKAIKEGGSIWLTYPKQSSKLKTDLNRNVIFPIVKMRDFTGVAVVSVDDTWSALRIKPVSINQEMKSVKNKDDNFGEYINKEKRTVTPPEELNIELKKNKKAHDFFNSLAFSHKKEYVQWILEAKREDTKNKRINGTIEMLSNNQKNPFE
jgi:hypothetical protein